MSVSGSSRSSSSSSAERASTASRATHASVSAGNKGTSPSKGSSDKKSSQRVNSLHASPLVEHAGLSSFAHADKSARAGPGTRASTTRHAPPKSLPGAKPAAGPLLGHVGKSIRALQTGRPTLVALNGAGGVKTDMMTTSALAGPETERVAQKTTPKTPYQKWQETMQDGVTNPAWDAYDATIRRELEGYNKRFSKTPGYSQVSPQVIKAMLWVESGGVKNKSWNTRPMQIGNKGDAGYPALKNGKDGSSLIMTEEMKADIKQGDINNPDLNVRAGIAYLFSRMAKYQTQSVVNPNDPKKYEYKVVKGDNGFDGIAKKVGSTAETIQRLNPGLNPKSLHAGDVIRYQKATTETVISGWRPFDSKTIASRYNSGDSLYPQKLDYVLSLLPNLQRP